MNVLSPNAFATTLATGRTSPGTRPPAATAAPKTVLESRSSSHQARARDSGASAVVQGQPGVALGQAAPGVREPVELDVVGRRGGLVEGREHLVQVGTPLLGPQRERRLRLERHRVDHAQRPEPDPGVGEDVRVLVGGAAQDRAVRRAPAVRPTTCVAEPAEPLAGAVRPGRDRARHGLRLDVAEVGQGQAGVLQQPVQPVQRHPALHGDPRGGDVEVDQGVVPVEPQLHVARHADRREGVPAADRADVQATSRRGRQHRGDLVRAPGRGDLERRRRPVAGPVRPSACGRARVHGATLGRWPPPTSTRGCDARPATWTPPSASSTSRRSTPTPTTWSAAPPAPRCGWRASRCAAGRSCDRVLARPGFAGVLAYALAEALWLGRGPRRRPGRLPDRRARGAAPAGHRRPRAGAGDADGRRPRAARPGRGGRCRPGPGPARCGSASTWTPRTGPPRAACTSAPRRSPVHSVDDAVALARTVAGPQRLPARRADGVRGSGGGAAGPPGAEPVARQRRPSGQGALGRRPGRAARGGRRRGARRSRRSSW